MKVGDLYRFEGRPYSLSSLDGRIAVYLGEAFIHFDDGSTIENHQVLMVGEATPRIIDCGVLKWMNRLTV